MIVITVVLVMLGQLPVRINVYFNEAGVLGCLQLIPEPQNPKPLNPTPRP